MTDEQLRALARRVLGVVTLYCEKPIPRYVGHPVSHLAVDAEDAAVAILREEMDKCPKCGSNDTLACCCECGVYWGKDGIREPVKITAAIYDPADDPTQSFVATT